MCPTASRESSLEKPGLQASPGNHRTEKFGQSDTVETGMAGASERGASRKAGAGFFRLPSYCLKGKSPPITYVAHEFQKQYTYGSEWGCTRNVPEGRRPSGTFQGTYLPPMCS